MKSNILNIKCYLLLSLLILLGGCKSVESTSTSTSGIVSENDTTLFKKFNPEFAIEQNQDVVKITYKQPDLVFYLFKNEELTFIEFPSGTFNHVNLDFTYNLSLEQALREIHFLGTQKPEWIALATTTEEVFAYELYEIDSSKIKPAGYYSPENFEFDFNQFKNKEVLLHKQNDQYLLYLVAEKDTIICKKNAGDNPKILLNQDLKDKIDNFKVGNKNTSSKSPNN